MRTLGKARSGCNPNQKNFGLWNMNEVQTANGLRPMARIESCRTSGTYFHAATRERRKISLPRERKPSDVGGGERHENTQDTIANADECSHAGVPFRGEGCGDTLNLITIRQ